MSLREYFMQTCLSFTCRPKEEVYNNMEALIYHFKIVMGEIDAPKAEVYHSVEGGNGELGFYLINDGEEHLIACTSDDLVLLIIKCLLP